MFRLSDEEKSLRSQIVTSSYGGRRYLPYVFTEQGVAMLSTVLNSTCSRPMCSTAYSPRMRRTSAR
jgi:hypothetical protein